VTLLQIHKRALDCDVPCRGYERVDKEFEGYAYSPLSPASRISAPHLRVSSSMNLRCDIEHWEQIPQRQNQAID
jgi:hypothetical protein